MSGLGLLQHFSIIIIQHTLIEQWKDREEKTTAIRSQMMFVG